MKMGPGCPERSPDFSILLIHTQQHKAYSYQILAALEKADPDSHFHSLGYHNWQGSYGPPKSCIFMIT